MEDRLDQYDLSFETVFAVLQIHHKIGLRMHHSLLRFRPLFFIIITTK